MSLEKGYKDMSLEKGIQIMKDPSCRIVFSSMDSWELLKFLIRAAIEWDLC